jgi:putative zinc finger/helix-turn-helix YgiT family protein
MAKKCPICGEVTLETRVGKYAFVPPPNIPGGAIVIENTKWDECTACKEQILSLELDNALENERYRRLGLLTPGEIRLIRERAGLDQVGMAKKLGIGDKTYARWESGHSLQNKSSDNLIRLFARDAGLFEQIEAERRPERKELIKRYFEQLHWAKGKPVAMAAHGNELSAAQQDTIHKRLEGFLKVHRKGKA